jgi:hypothetical protein
VGHLIVIRTPTADQQEGKNLATVHRPDSSTKAHILHNSMVAFHLRAAMEDRLKANILFSRAASADHRHRHLANFLLTTKPALEPHKNSSHLHRAASEARLHQFKVTVWLRWHCRHRDMTRMRLHQAMQAETPTLSVEP